MYSRIEEAFGIGNGCVWVDPWHFLFDIHAGLGNMEGQLGKA